MGLRYRRSQNANQRANGIEPEPGDYAGVKRWARYLKRVVLKPVKIRNPEKYLHSTARGMKAVREFIEFQWNHPFPPKKSS